jgi:hypothetical protein
MSNTLPTIRNGTFNILLCGTEVQQNPDETGLVFVADLDSFPEFSNTVCIFSSLGCEAS